MKTVEEVQARRRKLLEKVGDGDADKEARARALFEARAYEACLPRDFWDFGVDQISHNRSAWRTDLQPYVDDLKKARAKGYGVALFGLNGTGKTTFGSLIMQLALRARYSGYCTTSLRLDHDYRGARGNGRWARLDTMMTSDFLMIDELGKESIAPSGESWGRAHIERILKDRADERLPTIVVSNSPRDELERVYGRSVESLLGGKFLIVTLEPGDMRKQVNKKMLAEMKAGK